ncbi:hypothetical protein MNBD_BACTEROID04-761, partial [hydrothermal vent metagenome]
LTDDSKQTTKLNTKNIPVNKKEDEIDRIVIFYKNGTFKSYFS